MNSLVLCSSFYLLECAKYSGGKKNWWDCYIKNIFKSSVFRPTSLLVPAGIRNWIWKTPSMINELTSVTSPNQIFWIYFLVHLQNWGDCEIPVACSGARAFPINSSGTQGVTGWGESCCTRADHLLATWAGICIMVLMALNCKEEPETSSNLPSTFALPKSPAWGSFFLCTLMDYAWSLPSNASCPWTGKSRSKKPLQSTSRWWMLIVSYSLITRGKWFLTGNQLP